MNGLYRGANETSFVSDEQIVRESIIHNEPVFDTPLPPFDNSLHAWTQKAVRKAKEHKESEIRQERGKIILPTRSIFNFMADQHIGGAETDYQRIEDEAMMIVNTPNSYAILPGDLINAFFFNPAQYEDIDQIPQQIEYARAYCKFLADHKRLLAVVTGNHDSWVKKMGFDPYRYILEGIDTYYFHGQSYLDAQIGEQEYKICLNHMFKGSSIYSNTHPQNRAIRFGGAWGSDLVVSGHWHQKGVSQQVFTEYGGVDHLTTMMALGTYKASDEYIKTYGFSNRNPMEMYGCSAVLDDETHTLQPYWDIIQANAQFTA